MTHRDSESCHIKNVTTEESSLASYDALRESKHDSLADKDEHIATDSLILSDKVTVVSAKCTVGHERWLLLIMFCTKY